MIACVGVLFAVACVVPAPMAPVKPVFEALMVPSERVAMLISPDWLTISAPSPALIVALALLFVVVNPTTAATAETASRVASSVTKI